MLLSGQDVFNINFLAFCHQVQNFMADLQYLCYSTVDLTLDLPRADLISSLLNSKRALVEIKYILSILQVYFICTSQKKSTFEVYLVCTSRKKV